VTVIYFVSSLHRQKEKTMKDRHTQTQKHTETHREREREKETNMLRKDYYRREDIRLVGEVKR